MADATATRAAGVQVQNTLAMVQTMLALTAWEYPADSVVTNGSTYDYIVVGAGTAGSVVGNRLSADGNNTVLVIEAGGYPPLESELPGLFPFTKKTSYDFDYSTVNDNYTMQNLIGGNFSLIQGKLFGGCSSNGHMIYNRGDCEDFKVWAEKTNDTAWEYDNLQAYYKKQEETIPITQDPRPEVTNILSSLWELGNADLNNLTSSEPSLGYGTPRFTIDGGVRQNSALVYLSPARNRSNLFVTVFSTATKILIENKVATGVQVIKDGVTYLLYAKKEVIVAAGVINSPKLLMLSGIGPRSHLESFGIEVIADLPVGQNFMDQTAVPILFQMDNSTLTSGATNYHRFPTPLVVGNKALNSSTNSLVYQSLMLGFEPNSSALLNLCSLLFSYLDEICQKLYEGTTNKNTWLSLVALTLPESRGNVSLASADPAVAPLIYPGTLSNPTDVTLLSAGLLDHIRLLNTTYFKSVNATVLDLGLCGSPTFDIEYWKCYLIAMTTTIWHNGGTCAIGTVLDSNMNVKGVDNLRVVDSSSMPALTKGGIAGTVGMLAERVSDLILGNIKRN